MTRLDFTIVGAPRSGTSLLSSLIDSHPDVRVAHDSGLYYYLKFTLIECLTYYQTGNEIDFLHVYSILPKNSLETYSFVDSFLNKSPEELLSLEASDPYRNVLDQYLFRLWKFWTRDFNIPDPTKDRNKSLLFLKCINTNKLLSKGSVKDMIFEYQESFIASINAETPDIYDNSILIGEKTPDNNVCGDILNKFNNKLKVIAIVRNPCTLYAARKRRNLVDSPETFVAWHNLFGKAKHYKDDQILTIKYEELIESTSHTLDRIYSFLSLKPLQLEDEVNQTSKASKGLYSKYVGTKVDPKRDQNLLSMLTETEIKQIKDAIPYD